MHSLGESTEQRQSRLRAILEILAKSERVSVEELSALHKISQATIRRDLLLLEKQGLLHRDHGGAVPVEPLFYEAFSRDSSFQEQVNRQAAEKKRIGLAAAEFIRDGETIALAAGTTTTQVARGIPYQRRVTIFTNAVNMAMELGRRKNLNVNLTGGAMRGAWFSLVGPAVIESAQRVIFDRLFLGVSGISLDLGLTEYHSEEAVVNRVLLAQSRQKIVVADHTKFSQVGTCVVGVIRSVDLIITDTGLSDETLQPYLDAGIQVLRV